MRFKVFRQTAPIPAMGLVTKCEIPPFPGSGPRFPVSGFNFASFLWWINCMALWAFTKIPWTRLFELRNNDKNNHSGGLYWRLPDTVLNILHKSPPESFSQKPGKYKILWCPFHRDGNWVKVLVSGPEPRPNFLQSPSVNQWDTLPPAVNSFS